MTSIKQLIKLITVLMFLGGCSDNMDCTCASTSIMLRLSDANDQPVYAVDVSYSVDGGEEIALPVEALSSEIISISDGAGTFHLWVETDDQFWESGNIEVEMAGSDYCRRPETRRISITFPTDTDAEIESKISEGGGCG